MPTRNVNLTKHFDQFIETRIATGRFANASEAIRAGLYLLERDEQQYEAKLEALRAAIAEGDASGIFEGNPFDDVRASLNLPR